METAIKERPILFSGDSIWAILDGKKTVTRRVVNHKWLNGPCDIREIGGGPEIYGAGGVWMPLECPYGQPGDRLWVREAWSTTWDKDAFGCIAYKADGEVRYYICDYNGEGDPIGLGGPAGLVDPVRTWRPSIHMPRWASRITLEVKTVRVERLQEITEDDAEAEGFERREHFIRLWDKLNANRGHDFGANPWVWRVEFKRLERK